VTPSYNQAQFIDATIRSVLDQSYPDIEYHVMDGGSSDATIEVLRRHSDRLASWVSQKDGGQAAAINAGWGKSRGEILAYLNADDRYRPGAVAAAVDYFAKHPEAGIVYGSIRSSFDGEKEGRVYEPPAFDLERLLLENYIPQPTVFIRRSVLNKIGMLNRSLRYCLDYDLWLRAAIAGIRFGRIDGEPMAEFRLWTGSKTSNDPDGWARERIQVLDQAFVGAAPSRFRSTKPFAQARGYVTVAYSAGLSGDAPSARRYLKKALAASPVILKDPQFWKVGVSSLLGRKTATAARRAVWYAAEGDR
jgi:glycosyltransferase involved in cell wall biosynthesis